jgi:hypothetical protein
MKRIAFGIVLLIPVIAGCQQDNAYFYNADKNLEQAMADCQTCHEALIRATEGGTQDYSSESMESLDLAGDKCMEVKGYAFIPKEQLPDHTRTATIHNNRLSHNVAGK